MTTALDTNVLVALWNQDEQLNMAVRSALDAALGGGAIVVAAPVFAELLAFPHRDETFLDSFFRDTGIAVDWTLSQSVWRAAGRAFQAYAARRRRQRDSAPRRILADFLIGAHASQNDFHLLTLDERLYRAAFPRLSMSTI
jgi:predicted nucleic acid-binding protein